MVDVIENLMVVDAVQEQDELYALPDKKRLKRERQAYEEAEREAENEWYPSGNFAEKCNNYL